MKYLDIAVTVVFVLILGVIYFFWGCQWDLYATILAAVVIVTNVLVSYFQGKRWKALKDTKGE